MNQEEPTMFMTFETSNLHKEELDREIESIRTERLLRSASPPAPGLPSRTKAAIGRRLISLGTSLVGTADAVPTAARSTAQPG